MYWSLFSLPLRVGQRQYWQMILVVSRMTRILWTLIIMGRIMRVYVPCPRTIFTIHYHSYPRIWTQLCLTHSHDVRFQTPFFLAYMVKDSRAWTRLYILHMYVHKIYMWMGIWHVHFVNEYHNILIILYPLHSCIYQAIIK